MKLNDVFESTPKSVHEVISESGTCFHIPEYQRPYSWNEDKVSRLFDDIKAGCSVLVEHDDAITFLGTLLTVDDYKGTSLSPELKAEKPPKTRLVIDGQQRLTTLTLISTRLYLKLNQYLNELTDVTHTYSDDNEAEGFCEEINKFSDNLYNIVAGLRFFSKDTNSRDKYNRYYPLLSRSGEDTWSKQKNQARYNSAIAEYIHKVTKATVDDDFHVLPSAADTTVSANLKVIDQALMQISNGYIFNNEVVTDLCTIDFRNYQQETFFDIGDLPSLLKSNFLTDKDVNLVKEAIYLSAFSSYLLYRTCFTFVSVNNLDYAFDMFEALNTTGEPLTAYETFRPKAIQFFHSLKERSLINDDKEGRKYLGIVDGYLNSISDANKKNDATKKLVEVFSYAKSGKRCGTHISQQRRYLIDSFSASDDKLKYLQQLADTAEFLFSIWYSSDETIVSQCVDSLDQQQEFKLSIGLLKSTGHEIARPFLSIAYHYFKQERNTAKFKLCTKLLAAFWTLRRAGTGGTAGIDSRYKELYSGSAIADKVTFDFPILDRLSEISHFFQQDISNTFSGKNTTFDTDSTRKDWLKKSIKIQQYATGKQLGICRLLLLASMHNVAIDPECSWKTVQGKEGCNPTLSFYNWSEFLENSKIQFTIEHIAPQQPKDFDWDSSLDDGELINTLGNLVILTRGDNSEASNNSWLTKQTLYKELAIKKSTTGIVRNYNQFIQSVANAPAWRTDIIVERSENLLNNSWNNLINWLIVKS